MNEISSSKKESYSFSTEVNGVRKSVSVRQVENGWILSVHKSWETKEPDGSEKYNSEDKEYISTKDPRELIKKSKKPEPDVSDVSDLMSSLSGIDGLLLVQ